MLYHLTVLHYTIYVVWSSLENFVFHFLCRKVGSNFIKDPFFHKLFRLTLFHQRFADCEHLIRHMLVVEPERRFSLLQISQHRWMSPYAGSMEETKQIISSKQIVLDSIVIKHMLELPNLTFDEIADSVHQNSYNHIYAIYNLLVDKLSTKRKEQQRLQHHAGIAYSR